MSFAHDRICIFARMLLSNRLDKFSATSLLASVKQDFGATLENCTVNMFFATTERVKNCNSCMLHYMNGKASGTAAPVAWKKLKI